NTASDGSSTLFRLDGFKKQLEEREALLKQKENNIKKTIEDQVAEEHKRLKDDYNDLIKDKEIGKLSASIFQLKNDKNALKKDFASAKKAIKVLDGIIYSKDKTIIAYNKGLQKINPS
ncbi:6983_t:CDS:2, partial [Funneliformis geosporum]